MTSWGTSLKELQEKNSDDTPGNYSGVIDENLLEKKNCYMNTYRRSREYILKESERKQLKNEENVRKNSQRSLQNSSNENKIHLKKNTIEFFKNSCRNTSYVYRRVHDSILKYIS